MTTETFALFYSIGIVTQAIYLVTMHVFWLHDNNMKKKLKEVKDNLPLLPHRIVVYTVAVMIISVLWPLALSANMFIHLKGGRK